MNTLFPIDEFPPGFSYYPNFIDMDEEHQLLQAILQIEVHPMIFQGYQAKRNVASFGYDWSFEKRTLSKGKEIPGTFHYIMQKLANKLSISEKEIAEVLLTEYPVSSVINWHRDAPPFDIIAGISLLSDCVFKLRPYDKTKQKRGAVISLPVKRRSLYVMKREVRSEWEHSIAAVKQLRYSITFRTLR